MKKIALFSLAFLLFSQTYSQSAKHVILITIDGFRPDFYLKDGWNTPNIRALMKNGTHATGVTSVFPSMTYPSHIAMVTGVRPATHGIYYNNPFKSTTPTGRVYWNAKSIKVPTIWEVVENQGMKAAALFWPVSGDAKVSYNIPDVGSMGDSIMERYSKPEGFISTLKKEVFGGVSKIDHAQDQNIARIAEYVIKKDRPNLMTVHFFWVDHIEHQEGREGDKVKAAVAAADSAVGIVINALKQEGIWDSTALIVTGDHGFADVKTIVCPNVWLAKAGLLNDAKNDDWKAQFYTVGGSAYLYLKDEDDTKTLQQVKDMLAALPENEQKLFRIIDRKQLDAVQANPEVAFALSGENGAAFNGAVTGEAIKPGKGGSHGYFPDFYEIQTGFVAHGPGVKKGGVIKDVNVWDMAPTMATLLGVTLNNIEGKVPAGLLEKK